MPHYEKVTLDRFKLNLKEGKYATLTGARRAIGKTTTWTAKEKEQAQEIANKFFGENGAAAKPAAKAGPKKTAAKKTSAKKTAAAAKPTKTKLAKASPTADVGTVKQITKTVSARPQPSSTDDHRIVAREGLEFVNGARNELEALKRLNPQLDTKATETELVNILSQSVGHMNRAVKNLPAPVATAVPRIELPKDEPKAEVAATETVAQVSENGTVDDSELSDAERQAKAMFASSGSPNPLAGLPAPGTS